MFNKGSSIEIQKLHRPINLFFLLLQNGLSIFVIKGELTGWSIKLYLSRILRFFSNLKKLSTFFERLHTFLKLRLTVNSNFTNRPLSFYDKENANLPKLYGMVPTAVSVIGGTSKRGFS